METMTTKKAYQARNPFNQESKLFTGSIPGHIYAKLDEVSRLKGRSKAAIISETLEATMDLPSLLRYTTVRVMQERATQRVLTEHELDALYFAGEQILVLLRRERQKRS